MLGKTNLQLRFSLNKKEMIILSHSHQSTKEKNQAIKLFQKHKTQAIIRQHYNKKICRYQQENSNQKKKKKSL